MPSKSIKTLKISWLWADFKLIFLIIGSYHYARIREQKSFFLSFPFVPLFFRSSPLMVEERSPAFAQRPLLIVPIYLELIGTFGKDNTLELIWTHSVFWLVCRSNWVLNVLELFWNALEHYWNFLPIIIRYFSNFVPFPSNLFQFDVFRASYWLSPIRFQFSSNARVLLVRQKWIHNGRRSEERYFCLFWAKSKICYNIALKWA